MVRGLSLREQKSETKGQTGAEGGARGNDGQLLAWGFTLGLFRNLANSTGGERKGGKKSCVFGGRRVATVLVLKECFFFLTFQSSWKRHGGKTENRSLGQSV